MCDKMCVELKSLTIIYHFSRNFLNEWKIDNKIKLGSYTKPNLRKKLFIDIKAANTHGTKAGKWSARKAQLLAKKYKALGGGYY